VRRRLSEHKNWAEEKNGNRELHGSILIQY